MYSIIDNGIKFSRKGAKYVHVKIPQLFINGKLSFFSLLNFDSLLWFGGTVFTWKGPTKDFRIGPLYTAVNDTFRFWLWIRRDISYLKSTPLEK